MKVFLINPCSVHVAESERYRRFVQPMLPLGIASIAAVLENDGVDVRVVDQHADVSLSDDRLIRLLCEENPQVVGFSCLTLVMNKVKYMVKRLKNVRPDIKVVLGNIHPTVFHSDLVGEDHADVVVLGEGEYTFRDLIRAFEKGHDLKGVKGISFKDPDGKIVTTQPRPLIEDLDELPFPAWHLFNLEHYSKGCPLAAIDELAVPVVGSRGCPFKCVFCSQDKFYPKPRYRKTSKIVDEIEYLRNRFGIKSFGFNDANFPFSIKQGLDFCDEFMKRGLHKKMRWITESRVDLVNEELLMKMKQAGAHLIMYGFEVGNQDVLTGIGKRTTLEQARIAMKATKKAGILSLGLFMLGVPGDTRKTCEETIAFAKELDCDFAKFNIAVPLPGSKFFEMYKDQIDPNDSNKFTSWSDWSDCDDGIVFAPEGMTSSELIGLQRKAMFTYYFRPKIIWRHLVHRTISIKNLFFGANMLCSNYFWKVSDWATGRNRIIQAEKEKTGL